MPKFIEFPALENCNEDGLLAMGGNLSRDALVSAYSQGIFPWFNEGQPILWWSPDPRLVLFPDELNVSRSLAKVIRRKEFRITADHAFAEVIDGCATRGLPADTTRASATWITTEMREAYIDLSSAGYAHSIETWSGDQLVGGLYGIALGKVFFGESMFSRASNASKVALWGLAQWLKRQKFELIDCQISNDHLLSLGAREIPRQDFIAALQDVDIQTSPANFASGFDEYIESFDSV